MNFDTYQVRRQQTKKHKLRHCTASFPFRSPSRAQWPNREPKAAISRTQSPKQNKKLKNPWTFFFSNYFNEKIEGKKKERKKKWKKVSTPEQYTQKQHERQWQFKEQRKKKYIKNAVNLAWNSLFNAGAVRCLEVHCSQIQPCVCVFANKQTKTKKGGKINLFFSVRSEHGVREQVGERRIVYGMSQQKQWAEDKEGKTGCHCHCCTIHVGSQPLHVAGHSQ